MANPIRREAVPTDAAGVILGQEYTDSITGIKGIAMTVDIHITGCDQVTLMYKDGTDTPKHLVVDATRLEELEPQAVPVAGGPAPDYPTRSR